MKNIIPPDLSQLSMEELDKLHWEITEEAYQKTKPIREEIHKRFQNKDHLKKAS